MLTCWQLSAQKEEPRSTVQNGSDTLQIIKVCNSFSTAITCKDFVNADDFFDQVLSLSQKAKYSRGFIKLINMIDDDLIAVGNYKKAIEYLFKLKKAAEQYDFYAEEAVILNVIGVIYWQQGDPENALIFYGEYLALLKRTGIKGDLAAAYNNIGLAYRQLNQHDKAVSFYKMALQLCMKNGSFIGAANAYNNIGTIYQLKEDFENALYYHKKSLDIRRKVADSIGISMSLGNLGFINMALKNYDEALVNLLGAYGISKRLNDPEGVKETCEGLSTYYELMKKPVQALAYYKEYIDTRDSLMSQEAKKELLIKEIEFKYEQDEKEKLIIIEADKKRQQLYTGSVVLILAIVLFFSALLYKRFNLTKRQKTIIEHQKQLVEEKQKEITDSIHYAKRIQTTLIAHDEFLKKNLPQHFILYKPKDIVSGDFYWATTTGTENESVFYLAVCDSTGHGVPGAFMSLLNISFLNEAINEKNIASPNAVFNHVRRRLIENVSQDGGQDGMDGILVRFNKSDLSISYAAANNAPLVIRNGEVIELGYDKLPVGLGELEGDFTDFKFQLQPNDMLYLFTDGYADQFGGPKAKKFMYHRLNELLLNIHQQPLNTQELAINNAFETWKGHLEQIDDVCVIGIKI